MNISLIDVLIVAAFLVSGGVLVFLRVDGSSLWRATVTPLASIIGSGFLVSAPLMAQIAGRYAFVVMLLLCVAAYFIGSAIRHNINVVETQLEHDTAGRGTVWLGMAADLALSVAYVISICFYIKLLAAFALKPFGIAGGMPGNVLTTVIVASLGILGFVRGFGSLETLEEFAVSLKLAVIAALLAGLLVFGIGVVHAGTLVLPPPVDEFTWHSVRMALGALLIIQGFETSRYLGAHYDPQTRVRSMRLSQLLAGGIYIVFIVLITPLLADAPDTSETAIINYARIVAPLLTVMLTVGAIAAQLSAATADFVGSAGLTSANFPSAKPRYLYPLIAAVVIALTWATDIFEVLTLASRAFAAYYAIQCILALMTSRDGRWGRIVVFSIGLAVSLGALIFGVSAH